MGITTTPNLGLEKPNPMEERDTWGGYTNLNWDRVDAFATAALKATSALSPAADRLAYFTGTTTAAVTTLTPFARMILDDIDAAAVLTTIGAQGAANAAKTDAANTFALMQVLAGGVNIKNGANDAVVTNIGDGQIAVAGVPVALNSVANVHTAQRIELGNASDTTITRESAGRIAVENVPVAMNGLGETHTVQQIELGNISDTTLARGGPGVLTVENVPVAMNAVNNVHTAQQIELGHISDTTITRSAAGQIAVEGVDVAMNSATQTHTAQQYAVGNADSTITRVSAGKIAVAGKNILTEEASGNLPITGDIIMSSSFLRNRIINGDMRIAQRTTAAVSVPATNTPTFAVDRTYVSASGAAVSAQRSNDNFSGILDFTNALRVGGNAGNTAIEIGQRIENVYSAELAGKSVTFSVWASVTTGPQTFQLSIAYANAANNFSAVTLVASQPVVIFDTMARYSITAILPAAAVNGVLVRLSKTDGWTSSTNILATTGWQFEPGSTPTPFERRPYGTELVLCRRYYEILPIHWGGAVSLGNYTRSMLFYAEKRVAPTVTTAIQAWNGSSWVNPTISPFLGTGGGYIMASLAVGQNIFAVGNSVSQYQGFFETGSVTLSAEL